MRYRSLTISSGTTKSTWISLRFSTGSFPIRNSFLLHSWTPSASTESCTGSRSSFPPGLLHSTVRYSRQTKFLFRAETGAGRNSWSPSGRCGRDCRQKRFSALTPVSSGFSHLPPVSAGKFSTRHSKIRSVWTLRKCFELSTAFLNFAISSAPPPMPRHTVANPRPGSSPARNCTAAIATD